MSYIKADKNGIKTVSGKSWRLVHDGIQVMELAEQDFETSAGGDTKIFVVNTKEEADAEIARLKLVVPQYIVDRYKAS